MFFAYFSHSSSASSSLNVSKSTALKYLRCYDNQLTGLDVSACTALIYLSCEYNQLTSLDVSNCKDLSDNDIKCDAEVEIIRNTTP